MKKKWLSLLMFAALANALFSTTITSIQCGPWSNPTTWDLNRVPLPTDTILVNSFVSFDTDFTSNSPGMLNVTICGTLCGAHSYTGHFLFNGVVFVYTLVANYGASASYADVNVQQMAQVSGGASYTVYAGTTCVGCTSHCQNCSTNNKQDSLGCAQNAIASITSPRVNIFPNPTTDKIFVKGETELGWLILNNPLGKVIRKVLCTQNEITLETNALPPGVYTLFVCGKHYRIIKD